MPVLMDMGKWNRDHGGYRSSKSYYTNVDAVEKVIRYITRTRCVESRSGELISVGGAGVICAGTVEEIIVQFLIVQNFYQIDKRGGRRVVHEILSFTEEEFNRINRNYALVNLVAREISAYFYLSGFQVVYAVHHDSEKHVHIHLAVNTINFKSGKKFHSGGEDFKYRIKHFQTIFENVCHVAEVQRKQVQAVKCPVVFTKDGGNK